jgi:hypothetical protein
MAQFEVVFQWGHRMAQFECGVLSGTGFSREEAGVSTHA